LTVFAAHARTAAAVLGAFVAGLIAGCGSTTTYDSPTPPSETQKRLNSLGDVYLRSTMRHNRPPKSLLDLAQTLKDTQMKADDVLKSADDGQPFEIVWGVDLRSLQATGSDIPIVAFEKTGKDGKRHVLRGRSEILLMTESELRSGKFPDGYKLPF
jgi:hypothetical protein